MVLGTDIESDLVACDFLVREHSDQVSCDGPTVLPAKSCRQLLGVTIEFRCSDISVLLKISLAAGERLLDIAT